MYLNLGVKHAVDNMNQEYSEKPDGDWDGYKEDGWDFLAEWNGKPIEEGDQYSRL